MRTETGPFLCVQDSCTMECGMNYLQTRLSTVRYDVKICLQESMCGSKSTRWRRYTLNVAGFSKNHREKAYWRWTGLPQNWRLTQGSATSIWTLVCLDQHLQNHHSWSWVFQQYIMGVLPTDTFRHILLHTVNTQRPPCSSVHPFQSLEISWWDTSVCHGWLPTSQMTGVRWPAFDSQDPRGRSGDPQFL